MRDRESVRACVRACVRSRVRAFSHACMQREACIHVCIHMPHSRACMHAQGTEMDRLAHAYADDQT